MRDAIAERLEEAKTAGLLTEHASPAGIAAAVGNNLVGLAAQACGQISDAEVTAIFEGMTGLLRSIVKPEHW